MHDFSRLPVDRTVAQQDGMQSSSDPEGYFRLGCRALELIRLAAELCNKPHYPDILDLPCGHGRVLRWLRAHYDYARITACDLDRNGVDFCAKQFRAIPVYSEIDLRRLPFTAEFDLIWVGSLLTHLPRARWLLALDCLMDWTRDDGVLIFTTHGRTLSTLLARGRKDIVSNLDHPALFEEFRRTGFAYQPYAAGNPEDDYGLNLSSPEWVLSTLQRHPNMIIRAYLEEAWGMQDVIILYKKARYFEPMLE